MRRQITTIIAVAGLAIGPAAVAGASPYSPDAQDANALAQLHAPRSFSDLRSPDARDAATSVVVPSGVITKAKTVELTPPSSSDGFDWGSAGIGAGGIAVAVAGLGALFIVRRQRHTGAPLAH
jgi:hypothetical protein